MKNYKQYLQGGNLRSIGRVDELLPLIQSQEDFDELFPHLFADDRVIAMRASDAIAKITKDKPAYLSPYKNELIKLLSNAHHKEFKWHISLLVSRVKLTPAEAGIVWDKLTKWTTDPAESRIARVNALQALYDLSFQFPELKDDLMQTIQVVQEENIPSINARIRQFKTI